MTYKTNPYATDSDQQTPEPLKKVNKYSGLFNSSDNQAPHIRVGRPEPDIAFRALDGDDMPLKINMLEKKSHGGQLIPMVQDVADLLLGEPTVNKWSLHLCQDTYGDLSLWPIRSSGPSNSWITTAIESVAEAKKQWVRVYTDTKAGTNHWCAGVAPSKPVSWPKIDLERILELAFHGELIVSRDDPRLAHIALDE